MLIFTHRKLAELHYVVGGHLSAAQLEHYYATLRKHYEQHGKLQLLVTVDDFRGYRDLAAVLRFLRHEPTLLWRVRRAAFMVDQPWLRYAIRAISLLAFWIDIRTYSTAKETAASRWLQAS